MFTHELVRPLEAPHHRVRLNVRFRWRLRFLNWLFVAFEALVTAPQLVRRTGPGLPPEREYEFKPTPYYYR